jgi:hypothetical protein
LPRLDLSFIAQPLRATTALEQPLLSNVKWRFNDGIFRNTHIRKKRPGRTWMVPGTSSLAETGYLTASCFGAPRHFFPGILCLGSKVRSSGPGTARLSTIIPGSYGCRMITVLHHHWAGFLHLQANTGEP